MSNYQKGHILILTLVIAISMIGTAFWVIRSNFLNTKIISQNTASKTSEPGKSRTPNPRIPDGWVYKTSDLCDVGMLLPPNIEGIKLPDGTIINFSKFLKDGYYWSFNENNYGILNFKSNTQVNLKLRDSGTDADYGSVKIYCMNNINNADLTEIFNDLQSNIKEYGKNQTTKDLVKLEKREETFKWETKVIKLTISDLIYASGDYYLLTNKNKIYLVKELPDFKYPYHKILETIHSNIQFR